MLSSEVSSLNRERANSAVVRADDVPVERSRTAYLSQQAASRACYQRLRLISVDLTPTNRGAMSDAGDNVGPAARAVVIMGPAGAGKTTVGRALAAEFGATFVDADAHHPSANIDKMRRGDALTDEDRKPWLERLTHVLHPLDSAARVVLACSALKASYRSVLSQDDPSIVFACLMVPHHELARRLASRSAHFFDLSLLQTQLEALEVPVGCTFDGTLSCEQLVSAIASRAHW